MEYGHCERSSLWLAYRVSGGTSRCLMLAEQVLELLQDESGSSSKSDSSEASVCDLSDPDDGLEDNTSEEESPPR